MKKSVLLAVSLSFCATPVLADYTYYNQDNMQPRQYNAYNGNGGYSDNFVQVRPMLGVDYAFSKVDLPDGASELFNDKFNSLNVTAGVKIGQYVGLEAFFQKSGDSTKTVYDIYETTLSFHAYGADLAFYIPLVSQYEQKNSYNFHYYTPVNLLAAIGVGQYKAAVKLEDVKIGKISKTAPRFGAGLQFNFNDTLALRTMGRYVLFDDEDVDNLVEFTVGLRAYF